MSANARSFGVVRTVLIFLFCVTATAQAQNESRFVRWMYQDIAALARVPSDETPLYLTGGAAGIMFASRIDRPLSVRMDRVDEGSFRGFFDTVNMLGGSNVVYPAAGIFATSLVFDSRRFQDAAFTSLQSLAYSQLLVSGMKSMVGRLRPYRGEGPYEFSPFSEHTSFPSGHTSAAFALTVPWAVYYPNVLTYSLVGASVGTAIARMAREKHWLTDVVVGGTVASLMGYWLARRHLLLAEEEYDFMPTDVTILPTIGRGAFLVSFSIGL